jgi:hypothetical protein
MQKHKPQFLFRYLVVAFLSAYLLGSFTNMLLIPRYAPAYSPTQTSQLIGSSRYLSRDDFHAVNFLQIFDKSTIDNDGINKQAFSPKSFELIFKGHGPSMIMSASIPPKNNIYNNHQYSYLSFCTFRI